MEHLLLLEGLENTYCSFKSVVFHQPWLFFNKREPSTALFSQIIGNYYTVCLLDKQAKGAISCYLEITETKEFSFVRVCDQTLNPF